MAARSTFSAEERAAARKNRFTSRGAVGWLMTPAYVDSRVCVTNISTYGGRDRAFYTLAFFEKDIKSRELTLTFSDFLCPYGIPSIIEAFNHRFDPMTSSIG